MDGNERDPSKQLGPNSKPVKMTPEQEDAILEATLNGLSEKKIKALISKMLEEGK